MKLPPFEYLEPESMTEACRALSVQNGNAQIIAGGTELLQAMKHHLRFPQMVVSLERVPHLTEICYSPGSGLTVGSLATLRSLAAHDSVKKRYSLVADAALTVGGAQLQAMGTVGGNLCQDCCCIYYNRPPNLRVRQGACYKLGGVVCHAVKRSTDCRAVYCGDLAPVLMALKAEITLVDQTGEKAIPIQEMYSGEGARPLVLEPSQVVQKIHVPERGERTGGAYLKLRQRKAIDYPLLGVAAALTLEEDRETCQTAGVAMTGIDCAPVSVHQAVMLEGQPITDDRLDDLAKAAYEQARPVANVLGYSPRYRRDMIRVYIKTVVKQALASASSEGDSQ